MLQKDVRQAANPTDIQDAHRDTAAALKWLAANLTKS